jgi:hypothetical protein
MKKLLVTLCIVSALAIAAHAGEEAKEKKTEGKRPELTEEQKTTLKGIKDKYDTNKDGKLDETERANVSDEDKAKLKEIRKAGAKKAE